MNTTQAKPLFTPGAFNATPGITHAFPEGPSTRADGTRPFLARCLDRHLAGDWGDLGDDDKEANDFAILDGSRILSAYNLPEGIHTPTGRDGKIYIITEASNDDGSPFERPLTTLLFPSEY